MQIFKNLNYFVIFKGLGGIQIDDLSPHSTDNVNNNQQLQPYVGRIFDGISPMGQHRTPISSSSSGPIIAEVTEELEMPNVTDPNRNGSKAFIQQVKGYHYITGVNK